MKKISYFQHVAFSVLIIICFSTAVSASGEIRAYQDIDGNTLQKASEKITLRPLFRAEQWYATKGEGLVLLKVYGGIRMDVLSWLMLEAHYAHVDNLYNAHKQKHIVSFDITPHVKLGPVVLTDRNRNEYHSNPGFYRYRNMFDIHIKPGLEWLRLFVSEELRIDSDQGRLNQIDIKAGLDFKIGQSLTLSPFYYLESTRRSLSSWKQINILGLSVKIRF